MSLGAMLLKDIWFLIFSHFDEVNLLVFALCSKEALALAKRYEMEILKPRFKQNYDNVDDFEGSSPVLFPVLQRRCRLKENPFELQKKIKTGKIKNLWVSHSISLECWRWVFKESDKNHGWHEPIQKAFYDHLYVDKRDTSIVYWTTPHLFLSLEQRSKNIPIHCPGLVKFNIEDNEISRVERSEVKDQLQAVSFTQGDGIVAWYSSRDGKTIIQFNYSLKQLCFLSE